MYNVLIKILLSWKEQQKKWNKKIFMKLKEKHKNLKFWINYNGHPITNRYKSHYFWMKKPLKWTTIWEDFENILKIIFERNWDSTQNTLKLYYIIL